MWGYELIELVTAARRPVEISGVYRSGTPYIAKTLGDFLAHIARLGASATQATIGMVIPHTIHADVTGDNFRDLCNVESLESHHRDKLSHHDRLRSRSLAVVVYAGGFDGLGIKIDDGLAEDIERLCILGRLDDDAARVKVEDRLIRENWGSWIRDEIPLASQARAQLDALTADGEISAYIEALDRHREHDGWAPTFDGDALCVDLTRLAAHLTHQLGSGTERPNM